MAGLLSIIGYVDKSPIIKIDSTVMGNAIVSRGDVRFTVTRIYMDDDPDAGKNALCIEWQADGTKFKSYIYVDHTKTI